MKIPAVNHNTYDIYGRKSYPEPLRFINQIQIEDPKNIKEEVFEKIGGTGWIELVAFPASAAVQVIPQEVGI